jgi:hypothetical protein
VFGEKDIALFTESSARVILPEPKFEWFKDEAGKFRFRLVAARAARTKDCGKDLYW